MLISECFNPCFSKVYIEVHSLIHAACTVIKWPEKMVSLRRVPNTVCILISMIGPIGASGYPHLFALGPTKPRRQRARVSAQLVLKSMGKFAFPVSNGESSSNKAHKGIN